MSQHQPPDPFIPPFLREPPPPPPAEYARLAAPRRATIEEPSTCGQIVMTGVYAVAVIAVIGMGLSNPLFLLGGLAIAGLIAQEYA